VSYIGEAQAIQFLEDGEVVGRRIVACVGVRDGKVQSWEVSTETDTLSGHEGSVDLSRKAVSWVVHALVKVAM
jgi:hypothetical protein